MSGLLRFGFSRKTAATSTGEEVAAAKQARQDREQADADRLKAEAEQRAAAAFTAALRSPGQGKQYKQTAEAIRKRAERAPAQKAKQAAKAREKAARDATQAATRAADVEGETHWKDSRGRKRKRKLLRSRADASSATHGAAGKRVYSDTEKALMVEKHAAIAKVSLGEPTWSSVAKALSTEHPIIFKGLLHQTVRQVVLRHKKGVVSDKRGRPPALPEFLVVMIIAAFTSVVSARTTIVSAPMLQPIAIGIIMAQGFGSLLNQGRKKAGVFSCSIFFVLSIIKERGWRSVRPQGDTRKLPTGWIELRWAMVLRLAYFVFVHEIPRALVINADHTGIMFTQVKGKTWITKAQAMANDKSVKGHGDKRQLTLLATTSAAGDTAKHQVVVQGTTAKSLPAGVHYKASYAAMNTKGTLSACFIMGSILNAFVNIASFCVTANHWSDNVTSRAYVTDVAVPYYRKKIAELRAIDTSLSKEFGKQVCILIVDCWWGWIDADFKSWLASNYKWIRLIFVPASCTPVAQPMDSGVIAKIKGILRRSYGAWVVELTQAQIKAGVDPKDIEVPATVPTCKKNLFKWLSQAVDELSKDKEGVVHCWSETQLLRAWERQVQAEASTKVKDLFPNLVTAELAIDVSSTEDVQAGYAGLAFTQATHDEEWVDWVDWAAVDVQTANAGSSMS